MLLTALDRVGLESNALNVPIGALSGGQFQEVLLAFALIGDPNVLLLDEPTAGIDAPSRDRLYRLIQKLQDESGLTAILISHDLIVVARSATNVLCLSRSNSCFGPPKTILTRNCSAGCTECLWDSMSMTFIELGSVALSASMAVAAGLVGCFAVMRRMTLAADAISHVALPGIGVALLLHVSPIIGALVMLFLGTILIWVLEIKTKISTERSLAWC